MNSKVTGVPMTQAAFDDLQRELTSLTSEGRRGIAERMKSARESEFGNDDDAALTMQPVREDQGFVEGRIAEVEQLLAQAEIIDEQAARAADRVQLGSRVTIRNGDEAEQVFWIVGPVESDPAARKLSYASPVGAALLGKRLGDFVEVQTPAGVKRLRVTDLQ